MDCRKRDGRVFGLKAAKESKAGNRSLCALLVSESCSRKLRSMLNVLYQPVQKGVNQDRDDGNPV